MQSAPLSETMAQCTQSHWPSRCCLPPRSRRLKTPHRIARPSAGTTPHGCFGGDTHLHTNLSPDAAAGGNRQFGHDQAYRLALGETVTAHNGQPVRLNRPLDFLVVADHSEYMGLFPGLDAADPELLATETGQRWYDMLQAGGEATAEILVEFGAALRDRLDLIDAPAFKRSVWETVTAKADQYYRPGVFTAFIGYEWSSSRGGGNMHRVVIMDGDAAVADKTLPFSSFDGDRPRELWDYLERFEATTGGRALAIPHNPNASAGLMLRRSDSDGEPITAEHANPACTLGAAAGSHSVQGRQRDAPVRLARRRVCGLRIVGPVSPGLAPTHTRTRCSRPSTRAQPYAPGSRCGARWG